VKQNQWPNMEKKRNAKHHNPSLWFILVMFLCNLCQYGKHVDNTHGTQASPSTILTGNIIVFGIIVNGIATCNGHSQTIEEKYATNNNGHGKRKCSMKYEL